jgi:hypothetical protein
MTGTLESIASCRAAVLAELERTHSPRESRCCHYEIERLDTHPLITGLHKDIYEAIEASKEGITTEALRERFGDRALDAINHLKQDWITLKRYGRWFAVLPEFEFKVYHHHSPTSLVCPV